MVSVRGVTRCRPMVEAPSGGLYSTPHDMYVRPTDV